MKAYTDLEQSKKLTEILPIESADMWFVDGLVMMQVTLKEKDFISKFENVFPCWSLAALLDVIPKYIGGSELRIDKGENDFSLWYDEVDAILPDITANNPVDACYEMILALHDNNLL